MLSVLLGILIIGTNPQGKQLSPQKIEVIEGTVPASQPKTLTKEQKDNVSKIKEEINRITTQSKIDIQNIASQDKLSEEDMNKQIEKIKIETELKILKLRREIAQIYGNTKLVKEFDNAIDHIEHPEKYRKPPVKVEREIREEPSPAEEKVR